MKYSFKQFDADFPDDAACLEFIFWNRWPDGGKCECGKTNCFHRVAKDDPENGDFYTFLALDGKTKLIAHYYTGKRSIHSLDAFAAGLAGRVTGRVHVTTDAWTFYPPVLTKYFWQRMDYATQQKLFTDDVSGKADTIRRYSPAVCKGTVTRVIAGRPQIHKITTSHLERVNYSVRTFNRRFTRLCAGYSKKLLNHRLSVSLFVAHYNFCKSHATLKTSPAVAHKLTDHVWTTEELVKACSETI